MIHCMNSTQCSLPYSLNPNRTPTPCSAHAGTIDSSGRRTATAAKVQYPNKDSYFGGYSADAKAGLGLYAFANGALYLGEYSGGKRAGRGLMVMPDGGVYRGGFAADRFEGQVSTMERGM